MRKIVTFLAIVAIVVAACGGTTTPTGSAERRRQPTPAGEHRAPSRRRGARRCRKARSGCWSTRTRRSPTSWTTFNAAFEAAHPGVTVDMSIVAPNELATTTQTRLAANDVDVVDMFAFDTGVQPYMKDVTPPIWQTLADAGSLMDLTDQPFVDLYDESGDHAMPAPTTARSTRSTWPASASAACTSTRTCSPRTTSRSRRPGASSSPPARRSRRRMSRA